MRKAKSIISNLIIIVNLISLVLLETDEKSEKSKFAFGEPTKFHRAIVDREAIIFSIKHSKSVRSPKSKQKEET